MSGLTPIPILHLVTGLNAGGGEKMVFQLMSKLDQEKYNSHLLSLDSGSNSLVSQFTESGITVKSLDVHKNIYSILSASTKLYSYLKKNQISIIHAHLYHALVLAALTKFISPSLKIIWTSHSSCQTSFIRKIVVFLMRPLRKHDILFMKDMKTWYMKNRYSIIPNGVELPKTKQDILKYDTFTFISVGRLESVKNHQLLIKLFARLSHINCNLHIVGSGPEYSSLNTAIIKLNLGARIQLMGYRDNVAELIAKSHCFLLPSLREGLPLVILESALCKVPIITSSQSISNTLIGKNDGYVTDLADFENAMLEVINNYENARMKAENFYFKVKQNYSLESCIQSHEHLYSKIANE